MKKLLALSLLTLFSFSAISASRLTKKEMNDIMADLNKEIRKTQSYIYQNEFRLTIIKDKISELRIKKITKTILRFSGNESPSASWKVDLKSLKNLKIEYKENITILKKKSIFLVNKLKRLRTNKVATL